MKRRIRFRPLPFGGIVLALLLGPPLAEAATYTVRLGDAPFITGGGMWVALERGYFEKVGVKVDLKKFNDGAFIVAPLLAGELDMGSMTPNAGYFNSIARGAQLLIILDRGRERPGRAYVPTVVSKELADKGLKSLADMQVLKGKKVGVGASGSINQYLLAKALQKAGLNPQRDVEWIVGVPQPDLVKMLCQKQIDAANIAFNLAALVVKNGCGIMVPAFETVDPDAQIVTYAVRKDFLQNNREAVVRWAMAYLQAVKDFNEAATAPEKYPDIVNALAKHTFTNTPEIVKGIAPHWSWVAEDGMPNVENIMAQQDYWADPFKLVEKKVSREQLFDLSVAKEAKDRLDREKPFGR